MKRRDFMTLLGGAAAWPLAAHAQDRPARILYFTHSAGYRHDVLPASLDVLQQIGATVGFEITASEDVAVFTRENLRRYGAIMFFTTGELPMNNAQQAAFTDFIQAAAVFSACTRRPTRSTSGRNINRSLAGISTSIPGIRPWSSR
jgi:uncharacterized protein